MHVHPCIYLHAAVQSHAGIFAPHYVIAAVFDRFGCCVAAECVLMASAIVHSRTHSPLRHFRLTSLEIPAQINTFYHNFGALRASFSGGHTDSR